MTDEQRDQSSPKEDEQLDARIFLCDASAEAGRLLNALQVKGYLTADVPLGLLPKRTHYEVPQLVICDADAKEAPLRLREMKEATDKSIAVLLVGHADNRGSLPLDFVSSANVYLERPLDVEKTLSTIAAIVGEPKRRSHRPKLSSHHKPPSLVASARKPYRSDGRTAGRVTPRRKSSEPMDAHWPIESPPGRGPIASEMPRPVFDSTRQSIMPGASSAPPSSGRTLLSPETQGILDEGRKRVASYPQQAARPIRLPMVNATDPNPVRSEFLAALDAPLEDDPQELEASAVENREKTAAGPVSRRAEEAPSLDSRPPPTDTGDSSSDSLEVPEEEQTNPGGRPPTQPPPQEGLLLPVTQPPPHIRAPHLTPLPLDDLSDLLTAGESVPPLSSSSPGDLAATVPPPSRKAHPSSIPAPMSALGTEKRPDSDGPMPLSQPTLEHHQAPSVPSSILEQAPGSLGRRTVPGAPPAMNSALRGVADAIQERLTGAVAQQATGGIRRIVLTDGDISTVSSSLSSESLAHFLHDRGDYTDEVLASLGAISNFGRHAGAALIARGLLQQEDLWPVLRAHAEWILGRALQASHNTQFEEKIPARLMEEPAVFGGAAGTEIFLEAVRRVVTPDTALHSLGGAEIILGRGQHETLLNESALTIDEQQWVRESIGTPLSHTSARHPELLPVLFALVSLDVLSTGGVEPPSIPQPNVEVRSREIDEEAFEKRILARRSLVDDGDYFSILGVARSATTYELTRAHDELLAEYAETRLTPRTLHLREELQLLRSIIDEAHLVLGDEVRRTRYRRALEAHPT